MWGWAAWLGEWVGKGRGVEARLDKQERPPPYLPFSVTTLGELSPQWRILNRDYYWR